MNTPFEQKRLLRETLREAVDGLTSRDKSNAAEKITDKVLDSREWISAETVLLYVATLREPDTSAIIGAAIESDKLVTLPRRNKATGLYEPAIIACPEHDLVPGSFGIYEPNERCHTVPWESINLIIAPGVGFDKQGYRLGHGGGFYDRMLPRIKGTKLGLAFDVQIVDELPREEHDQRFCAIVTESGFLPLTQ